MAADWLRRGLSLPLRVVLDTNFLTVPVKFGVDIFAEAERILEKRIEFVVLGSVVEELERRMEETQKGDRSQFRVALALLERCRVEEVGYDKSQPVDDQLLEYTRSMGGVLATNDRELRERAILLGLPIIILRAKKRLELVGSLF